MYAVRVGLRGMSDPHSTWSDTGAGVGVGPMVSDGLAGGGSSTPVVPPPVGGAFPYNNAVHQKVRLRVLQSVRHARRLMRTSIK